MTARFRLLFAKGAAADLAQLASLKHHADRLKRVRKALGLLEQDPRYPSLNSHKYVSLRGHEGEDVWDSYVENRTPGAWRIFWSYGPGPDTITILAITPHPD